MKDNANDEELVEYEGKLLPKREVLSLLSAGSAPVSTAGVETLAGEAGATDPTSGAAGTATGTGQSASGLADADASSSGTESVTDADRSETISQSDSAYSET
jgi:hypothetical protein